ncbi:MAG: methyltransferase domain-containing protein [Bacteroidota bacterium]
MILKENSALNRYQWAAKKIAGITGQLSTSGVTLFDIGARDNVLKQYLPQTTLDYKAFDLYPLNEAAQQWDIENTFPYQHPAPQIITMLEVIEHLKNPWLCMKNVAETMAPGGYLILTTPNPAWSNSRVNLLNKGYLSCFTQSDLELNHHVFTAWPHIVNRLLADTGFEITEYSTLDGQTHIFDKNLKGLSIPLKLISRITKKIIELKDPAACGMSYGIIAKRIA